MLIGENMKKFFKFFGICALMLFSFYYTEKIALYAHSKSPIMEEINNAKDNLYVSSVNAEIYDDYITPGLNGLEVNVNSSFSNMKSFDAFNSYYLVFDQIKPEISLENNKNKTIKQGNKRKRAISFILEDNKEIYNYLKSNNIKANVLVSLDSYDKTETFEILNNEINEFEKLETLLNKAELNNNICFIKNVNKNYCIKKEYYLVINNKELNGSNIASIKSDIESGDIILIKSSSKLDDFKLLLNQIKYQDLTIMYLSELITEENN